MATVTRSTQVKGETREELRPATTAPNSPRKTHSHVEKVSWNKCIFCQNENHKERLSSVMTLKMSAQIIEAAQLKYRIYPCIMRARV